MIITNKKKAHKTSWEDLYRPLRSVIPVRGQQGKLRGYRVAVDHTGDILVMSSVHCVGALQTLPVPCQVLGNACHKPDCCQLFKSSQLQKLTKGCCQEPQVLK